MQVGIDFDNTIVRYDHVFIEAARSRGWVPEDFTGTKKQVRDTVRLLDDGENKWQVLQAEVYGPRMEEALPFPGVLEFIREARRRGFELVIVSHKTQFSNLGQSKVDLRLAALDWMTRNGFFEADRLGFAREHIHFANTRDEKIAKIAALGCGVFIDDLEEVLTDPAFPAATQRVLFAAEEDAIEHDGIVVREAWDEIARDLLGAADRPIMTDVGEIAAHLTGRPIASMESARRLVGNNRLFRVVTDEGRTYALKAYPRQATDKRDRLSTEFGALEFMQRHGIAQVPKAIAKYDVGGYALYQWIEGAAPRPDSAAVDAAVDFVRALRRTSGAADARALPEASEACFSAQVIEAQVSARLATLQGAAGDHPALKEFLESTFVPAAAAAVARARDAYATMGVDYAAPIGMAQRCLSPSDFGFHNALRRDSGEVVFIDFEYFGWDDPVKLASDFVLHPGMDLPAELKTRYLTALCGIFGADRTFEGRLRASLPLYALRWTMILLNEFLPERWARRVMAGVQEDRAVVLKTQLDKARLKIKQTDIGSF